MLQIHSSILSISSFDFLQQVPLALFVFLRQNQLLRWKSLPWTLSHNYLSWQRRRRQPPGFRKHSKRLARQVPPDLQQFLGLRFFLMARSIRRRSFLYSSKRLFSCPQNRSPEHRTENRYLDTRPHPSPSLYQPVGSGPLYANDFPHQTTKL